MTTKAEREIRRLIRAARKHYQAELSQPGVTVCWCTSGYVCDYHRAGLHDDLPPTYKAVWGGEFPQLVKHDNH